MENRFNLIDEPWIPIEGKGKVGLGGIFTDSNLTAVGGNPLQKMSVYKLLLLIAQRSCGFLTESELREKGPSGIAETCVGYLEKNRDLFYLYGEKAFLQYPEIKDNEKIEYKTMYIDYMPDLASDNDSIIKESQTKTHFSDADKALFLVTLQSYALGGKRITKAEEYLRPNHDDERGKSAKSSPSLSSGMNGHVQTLILGKNVIETVFLNFFAKEDIEEMELDSLDLTVLPPWEMMPTFYASESNARYKKSFCAWFVPMTRFVFLGEDNQIKYCEGLKYSEEWHDPFLTDIGAEGRKESVDILKKPWNQIQALLTQIYNRDSSKKRCLAVSLHYLRAKEITEHFSIWSGGLKVRTNSGDQSVKQEDDYIESSVILDSAVLGEAFFSRYCSIIKHVNECGELLKKSIIAYKKQLKLLGSKKEEKDQLEKMEAVTGCMFSFWYEMGQISEDFVILAENNDDEKVTQLFKRINRMEKYVYDSYCPHGTAHQLLAWAQNRP